MSTVKDRRILWLDVLRVVGMLAVVVMHVSARVLPDRGDFAHPYWWTWALFNAFVPWCVPVFVMISGAVLLPNDRKESWGQFYRRRGVRLLVPLFAWTFVYGALRYLQGSEGDSAGEILMSVFEGRPYSHLWFLYMIVFLSVFTPMLRTFIAAASEKERQLLLVLCIVLATLDSLYTRIYSPIGHTTLREFMPFVGYYLLGYEVTRSDRRGPPRAVLVLLVAVAGAAIALVPYLLLRAHAGGGYAMFLSCYQSPAVLLMSLSVFLLARGIAARGTQAGPLPGRKILRDAVASVMGIYLVHPLLIRLLRELGLSGSTIHPAIGVPLVSLLVFGGAWCLVSVLRRLPWVRRTVS